MMNKFITTTWSTASHDHHEIAINGYCTQCGCKFIRLSEVRPLTKKELIKMVMDAGGPDAWQYSLVFDLVKFKTEKFDPTNRHFV